MAPRALPPFKAFTSTASSRLNRLINVVDVGRAFDPRQHSVPPSPIRPYKGLWDTGASNTVISKRVADELGLPIVGQTTVHHAGGDHICPTHEIFIGLPNGVGIVGILVTGNDKMNTDAFDVILGMDVINQGDFSITNVDGKTCLSFRIPSVETIDYSAQARALTAQAVGGHRAQPATGRNDLCPCGSGLKYKKCCGK